MPNSDFNRRDFLKASAVGATALTLTAAAYDRVKGANDRINIGFLGVGGRCQQHIDVILDMQQEKKGVAPVAVCDVWDGDESLGKRSNPKHADRKGRGLYPRQKPAASTSTTKSTSTRTIESSSTRRMSTWSPSPRPITGTPAWPSTPWRRARTSIAKSR